MNRMNTNASVDRDRGTPVTPVNDRIRAPQVRCIDQDGANLGVIDTYRALKLAQERGLDLVQVGAPGKDRIPTCKILNYGKVKFEESKKKKEMDKKQRQSAIKDKEIRFTVNGSVPDDSYLLIKAKQANEFIKDNIRVTVKFVVMGVRTRSGYKDIIFNCLDKFVEMIGNAQKFNNPSFDGKNLTVILVPKENKESK